MDAGCDQKAKSETFGASDETSVSDMGCSDIRVEAGGGRGGRAAVIEATVDVEDRYVHGTFPFLEVVFPGDGHYQCRYRSQKWLRYGQVLMFDVDIKKEERHERST